MGRLYCDEGDVGGVGEGKCEVVVVTNQVAHEGQGDLGPNVKKPENQAHKAWFWAGCVWQLGLLLSHRSLF